VAAWVRELQRRNVPRAAILYITSVWALSQGIAQLTPVVGAPDWSARWFLVAAAIGFPFWIAFAWRYELTPQGLKLDSEVVQSAQAARTTNRRLDFWIIGALTLAVVLLLTDRLVSHGSPPAPVVVAKSIAVLPLVNVSGDPGTLYFSDGLSEGFITTLSQFTGLKVIGRTSSFQFRGSKLPVAVIGEKLGVAHLLEGSVQRAGDAVRISAELIDTRNGVTLWSARYDRPYKDLFRLQDDITSAVAGALKAKLMGGGVAPQSDRPPSGNLEAYNAWLEAEFHFRHLNEPELKAAIDCLRRALRIDPNYAKAAARLSYVLVMVAINFMEGDSTAPLYAEARALADKALSLAPNLADAHAARGWVLEADADWSGAEKAFRRALALAPDDPEQNENLALLLQTLGKLDEGNALLRRALARDPLRAGSYAALGAGLMAAGHLDEAERTFKRAHALAPEAAGHAFDFAFLYTLRGNAKAAMDAAKSGQQDSWGRDGAIALAAQIGSDRKAADAALNALIARHKDRYPSLIALVYAARHDPDNMFKWLEHARAVSDPDVTNILFYQFFRRYRHDPRYAKLCRELNLPVPAD
jgi:TolB-like protein/Tfp pilus assembly protein PilF